MVKNTKSVGKDRVQMSAKPLYTVIVADDEDDAPGGRLHHDALAGVGFCLVGNASNGLDALQLVEKLEPDLLLTDIRIALHLGPSSWPGRCARCARPRTSPS